MTKFRFSRKAEADIAEIGDFIASDDPRRAVSFVAKLRERCRKLVEFPDAFPLRPELGEGVRMALLGVYRIFYVRHPDVLEIRRVLHGARRMPKDRT